VHAFLLNFDAELELEAPGRAHDVFAAFERAPERAAQLGGLLPSGCAIVGRQSRFERGTQGLAWCPTPHALAALAARGVSIEVAPPIDVLRLANDRALEERLSVTLPHAYFVRSEAELEAALAPRSGVERWLLKRAHAHRGRGRRTCTRLDDATRNFARRSFELGGIMVQPWVERTADFALHGYVDARGVVLGHPTAQSLNAGGAWLGSRRTQDGELGAAELASLEHAAREAGELLDAVGYEGPFGVDAFRYRFDGSESFCPRCELNARYSMGWAVGMAETRPDLSR
jgi:hypothetical protein